MTFINENGNTEGQIQVVKFGFVTSFWNFTSDIMGPPVSGYISCQVKFGEEVATASFQPAYFSKYLILSLQ